jgi:hypothetical protein
VEVDRARGGVDEHRAGDEQERAGEDRLEADERRRFGDEHGGAEAHDAEARRAGEMQAVEGVAHERDAEADEELQRHAGGHERPDDDVAHQSRSASTKRR